MLIPRNRQRPQICRWRSKAQGREMTCLGSHSQPVAVLSTLLRLLLPFLYPVPTKAVKSLRMFSVSYILKFRWVFFSSFHAVSLEKALQGRKLTTEVACNQNLSLLLPDLQKHCTCWLKSPLFQGLTSLLRSSLVLVSHLKFCFISLILMHPCNKQPQYFYGKSWTY